MDSRLIDAIKSAEGCRLTAYKDTLGFWTIGYGHLISDQSKDWTGYTITQAEADAYLESDIKNAQDHALYLPEWPSLDTPCRQNAVIELVYNMGVGKWRGFTKTRADIQNQYWQAAHDELLNSVWATQVGSYRSNRIAMYLLEGKYLGETIS